MPITDKHQSLTKFSRRRYRNPIHLALQWQTALDAGEYLSLAALARHFGVSRARVTQVMNLLKLSPEVIEIIYALGDPISAHVITEKGLRSLLGLVAEQQMAQVTIMLAEKNQIPLKRFESP